MELVWIVQTLVGIGVAVMGWFMRTLYQKLEEAEARLNDTREKYVHKDDIKDLKQDINHRFDKLENLIRYQKKDS